MLNVNTVILAGHLTRDPELRTIASDSNNSNCLLYTSPSPRD